jgi:hypothetical protein
MGRYEHDSWRQLGTQQFENIEPIAFWHLDIEEHQVGSGSPNFPKSVRSRLALADESDVRITTQQHREITSRQRFIVNHQDTYRR